MAGFLAREGPINVRSEPRTRKVDFADIFQLEPATHEQLGPHALSEDAVVVLIGLVAAGGTGRRNLHVKPAARAQNTSEPGQREIGKCALSPGNGDTDEIELGNIRNREKTGPSGGTWNPLARHAETSVRFRVDFRGHKPSPLEMVQRDSLAAADIENFRSGRQRTGRSNPLHHLPRNADVGLGGDFRIGVSLQLFQKAGEPFEFFID